MNPTATVQVVVAYIDEDEPGLDKNDQRTVLFSFEWLTTELHDEEGG